MNLDEVTAQDCEEAWQYRRMAAVLEDGKVTGFTCGDEGGAGDG